MNIELIGKTPEARAYICAHGKEWVVIETDEEYHVLKSEKTGTTTAIKILGDPMFWTLKQLTMNI